MKYVEIDGKRIELITAYGSYNELLGSNRDSIKLTLNSTYNEVKKLFVDDMEYYIIEVNDEGQEAKYDQSEYCLSCDIVDHRNDTVSVYMGKKTETELAQEALYEILFGI